MTENIRAEWTAKQLLAESSHAVDDGGQAAVEAAIEAHTGG